MDYSRTTNLAIIACPGGAHFADETIAHLRGIYAYKFNQRIDKLCKRYNVTKAQLMRDVNFYGDLFSPRMAPERNVTQYRAPRFKAHAEFTYFMNGEFKTEIMETIRGRDVFIFQDVENHEEVLVNGGKNKIAFSVNDHLMSLVVTTDAARHAGARSITLVLPVYPYSRQHKKKGREGLTASLLGSLYGDLGVDQIITLDIHSREIENGLGKARLANLHASYQIIRELAKIVDLTESSEEELVVVAPDTGAVDRNKFYSSGLKKPLAMLYKERDYSVVTQNAKQTNIVSTKLLGDVAGKTAFVADDMLGTGGTLLKAMQFLKENGAKKVIAAISLPLFTGNAVEQFENAYRQGLFYRLIGTNAVYHEELVNCEWYIKTDVSGLFAQAISRLYHNKSLSSLLDNRDIIGKLIQSAEKA